jgi:glycine betaine/choline ABC-type transport system substrate-binding protein
LPRRGIWEWVFAALLLAGCRSSKPPVIVVGSKSGVAQTVLGEVIAQHIERRLHRPVGRNFALGGAKVVYQAAMLGQVDVYVEDVGAARSEIFGFELTVDPSMAIERTRQAFERTQMYFLAPLGFSVPWLIVTTQEVAKQWRLETISDLTRSENGWRLGASLEFLDRADGLAALQKAYSLSWETAPLSMDPKACYAALSQQHVQLLAVPATDGALASGRFRILKDDRGAFGPYDAGLVLRAAKAFETPGLKEALEELLRRFDLETVRRLAAQAEAAPTEIPQIATEFLRRFPGTPRQGMPSQGE